MQLLSCILFLVMVDKNEANSSEGKCVAKETLVNGEKVLVDGSTEEQVKPIKLEVSGLIGESHDVGIDIKCGDVPTLSKRKRDSCMDLDASSGCKTSNDYEICVMCSKMRRYLICMHTLLFFLYMPDFISLNCQTKF